MRVTETSILLAVLSLGIIAAAPSGAPEPPAAPRLEDLLRQPLDEAFTPGREVIVSYVQIPPNTTLERHWHPGEEFHYYLEGEAEITIEGEKPIIGKPGMVGHVPFRKAHAARSGDAGATVIVFRVHEAGKPVRYLEQGGSEAR